MGRAVIRKRQPEPRLVPPPPGDDGPVQPCDVAPLSEAARERIGYYLQATFEPVVDDPITGALATLVDDLDRAGPPPVDRPSAQVVSFRPRR